MRPRRVVTLRALTDEQLAVAAHAGDPRAVEVLVRSYEPFLRTLALPYFDPAGGRDDILQEARIGLLKAVRDWSPEGGASFKSFLTLVVTRQVITHVKLSTRRKHVQLTEAVRVAVLDDGERVDITDALEAVRADPVAIICEREQLRELVRLIQHELSPLEREALLGFVFVGETYVEIEARIFGVDDDRAAFTPVKVDDNALTRARRKLRLLLEEVASTGDVGAASSNSVTDAQRRAA